jgi:signal transduction histidine kinase
MVMESYNAMAQIWLQLNNYAEAVDVLKRGMEIARERNNLELLRYYYQALIDSYRKLRNIDAVYEYYSLLMEVNRQMDAETFSSRINILQTERETLITAAEDAKNWRQQKSSVSRVLNVIALVWAILATAALIAAYLWYRYILMADVAKTQKRSYEAINELDSLRKNQEIAFRFLTTNVYTNINSLGQNIKKFEAEQGDMPVAADSPLNRINNEIFALYGFFQNFTLLLQAQSGQLMPVITTVNIPQLAHNLLADYEYYAASKEILLVNEVQNNTFAIADERLIDTVLRNMMSNAFKYAPEGKGRITVGTKVGTKIETNEGIIDDAGYVEVWVTDDGVGLDPA